MSITHNAIEYVTTQEATDILQVSYVTWKQLVQSYGLAHVTKPGKSNTYLWVKSEVEALLKPIPQGEKS